MKTIEEKAKYYLKEWHFRELEKLIKSTFLSGNIHSFRNLVASIQNYLLSYDNILLTKDHVDILMQFLSYDTRYIAQLILLEYEGRVILPRIIDRLIKTKSAHRETFLNVQKALELGYDIYGFDKQGFDEEGFDRNGLDVLGFNSIGINKDGFNREGYNQDGFNCNDFSEEGVHRLTSTHFDPKGYDQYGYDQLGFSLNGIHRETTTIYAPDGFNRGGYDKNGHDREGKVSLLKWQELTSFTTSEIPICRISWTLDEEPPLTPEDETLALGWADGDRTDDYTKSRMFSARTAEKFSIDFYKNLGFKVDDVSLSQIKNHMGANGNINDWKLYDLLLDDEICIDVKNARTSLNGNANYVEHCVSRFKNNRKGQNITIAGVLSPYLNSNKHYHHVRKIQFLGETTYPQLLKLEGAFSSRFLKVSLNGMNFIPRWFFEFPEKFYEQRNNARIEFKKVTIAKLPTLQECEFNPLPAYLSSGIELPDSWENELEDWQINFYNRIRPRSDNKTVSMPVLFLALLSHFLETLVKNNPWNNYEPAHYKQLLYSWENDMPLGIYDPLKTIDGLIGTFVVLWNKKEKIDLESFELFKFNGLGLLQGKRLGNKNYETILAYCGGFVDGKGKCGNSPLIIGENDTCPDCDKLICEKCGHCSIYCSLCKERMVAFRSQDGMSTLEVGN